MARMAHLLLAASTSINDAICRLLDARDFYRNNGPEALPETMQLFTKTVNQLEHLRDERLLRIAENINLETASHGMD